MTKFAWQRSVALAVACLSTGCGSDLLQPRDAPRVYQKTSQDGRRPATLAKGLYVSSYDNSSIYGFKSGYRKGHGPSCTIYTGPFYVNQITVDEAGNLIVPGGSGPPFEVNVYQGPNMCGRLLGRFKDTYGEPVEAATVSDSTTGTVVLANYSTGPKSAGNLAICTLAYGCTQDLTNSNVTGPAMGVALSKNGDCWLDSYNSDYSAADLTYWRGCTGPGQVASGFKNSSFGGLALDKYGNLLAIDYEGAGTGELWVYSGCDPACSVVGGPFALRGNPLFASLNAKGDTLAVTDFAFPYTGIVDVYKYAPTKLTHKYYFGTGYVARPEGIAFTPALQQ